MRISSLGLVLTGLWLLGSCGCSVSILRSVITTKLSWFTPGNSVLVGFMIYGTLHSVLVLVAGMLLHYNVASYSAWQNTLKERPSDRKASPDAKRVSPAG
jgi:hypothetical protein